MKRFFLLLLVLVLFTGTAAAEDADVFRSGDYEYTILEDGTVCVNRYSGEAAELTIPAELDGKTVTAIGDGAFSSCESLTAITIPDSVREVGANPFMDAPAAIRVSPEHPYLAVIDGVLFEKESKRLITFPYGSEPSEYAIPQGIRQIGDSAFCDCTSLTAVTIPDSVISIGDLAFGGCKSLTKITIPDSVISIGDRAFSSCKSLTEITIPDSVCAIGNGAFSFCDSLIAVTIPDSVREVGTNPFMGAPAAIRVSPEHPYLAVIDGVLFEKESKRLITYPYLNRIVLPEYVIPQGTRQIGDEAFFGCSSLTEITIPDSVTVIGDEAFQLSSSLTAITIPDSVTSIGEDAFSYCYSLTLTVGRDSYAAQYCKDNKLLYQYPDSLD